jgi:TRAP-type mannitol/chloroaromatic compound transport system permease small subunit
VLEAGGACGEVATMKPFLAVSAAIDRITELIGKSVSWLIFAAVLVSAINAVVRKTLNVSSNAWLELQWYLFGAAFMLASAYTLKQNEHIRIDIVYGAWRRRVQHWIDLFGHVVFLMPFLILMIWLLVPYVGLSACIPAFVPEGHSCRPEISTNAGGLIIWPAKALILGGFLLLFLQGISEIIKKIAVMGGIIDDPTPFVSSHTAAEIEAAEMAGEIGDLAGGDEKDSLE